MTQHKRIGPILFVHNTTAQSIRLAALVVQSQTEPDPNPLETDTGETVFTPLSHVGTMTVWRACFEVPLDRPAWYRCFGERYDLTPAAAGDLRLGYVSCNGEEHGDLDRDPKERNAMWARMCKAHRKTPFSLLLHGGDQIYADEVTTSHPLTSTWPNDVPDDCTPDALADLANTLRIGFCDRYLALYSDPDIAWIMARVPSLTMWDDHDICDGWGSLRRRTTFSDVGQTLFTAARDAFLMFQCAATEKDIPSLFLDPGGTSLTRAIRFADLCIVAPDLRSERGRRQIMGHAGWRSFDQLVKQDPTGRIFVMSSVPMLGPRLSIFELAMVVFPGMQKYEDDLRDQWQSRAHRSEWRRMLRQVLRLHETPKTDVTILSGEIHLATRATMAAKSKELHQLVASGVAHRPPPKKWAQLLGSLAAVGESPLAGHPIRIRPLPGQSQRYVAERNYLVLSRHTDQWTAQWELENSGLTERLSI